MPKEEKMDVEATVRMLQTKVNSIEDRVARIEQKIAVVERGFWSRMFGW